MKKLNFILVSFILLVILLVLEVVIVKSASRYEPQANVVYAKKLIPAKTVITDDMLEQRKISLSLVHKQSFRDISQVVGKRATADIAPGEMVLSVRVGSDSDMEEIKVKDKNNRLFTVEFKGDQANGWWLFVDQNVDILYIPNPSQEGKNLIHQVPVTGNVQGMKTAGNHTTTGDPEVVNGVQRLRNIRIAALIDEKGKLLENTNRSTLPKYVSFEVNDQQDEFLAYAKYNGKLELSAVP